MRDLIVRRRIPTTTERHRRRVAKWTIGALLVVLGGLSVPAGVWLFQELENRGCRCPVVEEDMIDWETIEEYLEDDQAEPGIVPEDPDRFLYFNGQRIDPELAPGERRT
jgi:hypothetical protein